MYLKVYVTKPSDWKEALPLNWASCISQSVLLGGDGGGERG